MHESTQMCIKHCQNGRMINKTHVNYLNAGMMCKLYVWIFYLLNLFSINYNIVDDRLKQQVVIYVTNYLATLR